MSGKQVHYLVPQFPAFALLVAHALDRPQPADRPWLAIVALALIGGVVIALPYVELPPAVLALRSVAPAWSAAFVALAVWLAWSPRPPERQVPLLAAASVLLVAAVHLVFVRPLSPNYDVGPLARGIAELQAAGRPVANDGIYHAQYQFAGRLVTPIAELPTHERAKRWVDAHPDGAIVLYFRPPFDPAPFGPRVTQPYRGRIAALFDSRRCACAAGAGGSREPSRTRNQVRRRGRAPGRHADRFAGNLTGRCTDAALAASEAIAGSTRCQISIREPSSTTRFAGMLKKSGALAAFLAMAENRRSRQLRRRPACGSETIVSRERKYEASIGSS